MFVSLNWQHQLCKNPRPNPGIKTLFIDHSCNPTVNGARPPPKNCPLMGPIPKAGAFPPIGAHGQFQTVVSLSPGAIACWMSNNSPSLSHPAVVAGPPVLCSLLVLVSFVGVAHPPNVYFQDDLTKAVVRIINEGSNVMSMDFHPQQQPTLLVGTNVGDISLWEVGSRERLAPKSFTVWDMSAASMPLQVWDAVAGCRQNEAPVYSVCPHHKENIQFIFPTAIDGKIKAWLYDCLGSRVDYDAPGHWCTMMAYSADGIRLFSCGTSKEGESHLVEWNEEGAIKRTYSGFRNAIYSCDGLLVYAGFWDGAVGIFDADNFRLGCRIAASASVPPPLSACKIHHSLTIYILQQQHYHIAAHPSEPNQILLRMSDGVTEQRIWLTI
ncbi:hypothetical protein Patl1_24477 [Pistacia atlantica]|uniref:Uncharacterized protein n=1 Tax=Pistacia atlantica TaxID=434234 RepID=A0ACC1A155_9ROSI|nr:hypothetical protein Patl1_24477 [Pistacia atlantica]